MRKIKRKIFQFLGVIVWIIGIKYLVEIFNALNDSYIRSNENGNIISYMFNIHNFMYNWSQVLVVFIYGLILFALGMIYDTVIKIREEQKKNDINWSNHLNKTDSSWSILLSKLEQLEKNMAAPQKDSTPHTDSQISQNGMGWTCPECGHKNSSSEQVCSICGLAQNKAL